MDFLELSTLDVIYDTYDLIEKTTGKRIEITPDTTEFDDAKTYEVLRQGLHKRCISIRFRWNHRNV